MYINKLLIKYIQKNFKNWDVTVALRYLPIIKKIKSLTEGVRVLDVGSGVYGLPTYLQDYDITTTDLNFTDKKYPNFRMVKASAEKLPFKDQSFEVVVCVDMMEHLPVSIREKSISEMIRVASSQVHISFPSGTKAVWADRFLAKHYKKTHRKELHFLNEHINNGLPQENEVLRMIEKSLSINRRKAKIEVTGNTNVYLWVLLLYMGFSENNILTNIYNKLVLILPLLSKIYRHPAYRVEFSVFLKK